jgi:oxygen-independent coproporphyrinogen-3 oxidase
MEANPGTIEQRYISEYAAAGVNRISLGIQSFNDQHLQTLGRIHSAWESIQAIESVAQIFDNFNLDIIYGLPQQSLPQALDDIQQAISFSPTHISAYNLTLEPNTEFAKHIPLGMPDNDLCYEMQDQIIEQLAAHNYQRYEISAFAKPRRQTQHNLNYWRFGDYLGIGAGAHAKISFPDKIIRQQRHKHPEAYMQKTSTNEHIIEQRTLSAAELPFEFMLGALRLIDGFENKLFSHSTGLSLNKALPQLIEAQKRNLIDINNERIKPTQHGLDFQNNLLEMFLN